MAPGLDGFKRAVGLSRGIGEGFGDQAEHGISGGMSMAVVQALEVVDVCDREEGPPALAPHPGEFPLDDLAEGSPVEEPGEFVARRQLLDLGRGPLEEARLGQLVRSIDRSISPMPSGPRSSE